ncbi:hypothetical protein AYI68_g7413 [Smittium mucronatum]|uniref:Uncharacterized protein n=1 Tax=Smittium mucronatum TaxID=133383 RepID=A0A1R0GNS6_9FUNG|nr:hypothetical protein AYI68_g7413 [Smittium mucronatum]
MVSFNSKKSFSSAAFILATIPLSMGQWDTNGGSYEVYQHGSNYYDSKIGSGHPSSYSTPYSQIEKTINNKSRKCSK